MIALLGHFSSLTDIQLWLTQYIYTPTLLALLYIHIVLPLIPFQFFGASTGPRSTPSHQINSLPDLPENDTSSREYFDRLIRHSHYLVYNVSYDDLALKSVIIWDEIQSIPSASRQCPFRGNAALVLVSVFSATNPFACLRHLSGCCLSREGGSL